ncbi:MAG: rhomboid family intramembrane serine protease [Lactobacillaceae bacterium]|jgi:membrane associated rhomboid family serine protease|nr:rhomboid family intramembrane serine protease [Lactobacillaceae bacterium]
MFNSRLNQWPIVTLLFIAINVYIFMHGSNLVGSDPFGTPTIAQIEEYNRNTIGSQPSLLLASMFHTIEHASFTHLATNMVAFLIIGGVVETFMIRSLYIVFILVAMLVTGVNVHETSKMLTVGASGIDFAMMTLTLPVMLMGIVIYKKFLLSIPLVMYMVLLIFCVQATLTTPNISNGGHFSGMVFGLIFGCFMVLGQLELRYKVKNIIMPFSSKNKEE